MTTIKCEICNHEYLNKKTPLIKAKGTNNYYCKDCANKLGLKAKRSN